MKEETTSRLMGILNDINNSVEGEKFIKEHSSKKYKSFAEYFNSYVAKSNLLIIDVVKKSGINQNYVYQILNGKKNPSRDKIIALCIASNMSFKDTNRALEINKFSPLYPKDERDARIAICINQQIDNVTEVNMYLEENGQELLNV